MALLHATSEQQHLGMGRNMGNNSCATEDRRASLELPPRFGYQQVQNLGPDGFACHAETLTHTPASGPLQRCAALESAFQVAAGSG